MFSNGQSMKDRNHTRAGATKKRKVTRRLRALRRPYSVFVRAFFSIWTALPEMAIAFLFGTGVRESSSTYPSPGMLKQRLLVRLVSSGQIGKDLIRSRSRRKGFRENTPEVRPDGWREVKVWCFCHFRDLAEVLCEKRGDLGCINGIGNQG